MTQNTQDLSLSTCKAIRSDAEKEALYFNTVTLARFMRACYGKDAAQQAERHVHAYMEIREQEIAGIWKRVVAHIRGVQEIEDQRRIVKVAKPVSVKIE